jgi:hypothetical protein
MPLQDLPGYVHTLARSRVHIGAIVGTKSVDGMQETVGSEGVFAIEEPSEEVFASLDATAPAPAVA